MTKQTRSDQTLGGDERDNPGGQFADKGSPQNGKSRDAIRDAGLRGTPSQDQADRRGPVDGGGPLRGAADTPSR